MNMYFVMGFLEVAQFGFTTRKEFSGFVKESPTIVEIDGYAHYIIGDVTVPMENITRISEIKMSGAPELDLTAIIGPSTHRPIKKVSKTPITDEFDDWYKKFIATARKDFNEAVKDGELYQHVVDEVFAKMDERLEFYRASIKMAEVRKDGHLARITFRYAVEAAQHLHIMTLSAATKNMSSKDILSLLENFNRC